MPGMSRKFKVVASQLGASLPREENPFWSSYAEIADERRRIKIPVKLMKDNSAVFEAEFISLDSPYGLNFLAASKVLEEFSRRHPGRIWDRMVIRDSITLEREAALKRIYENDIVRAASDVTPSVFGAMQRLHQTLSSAVSGKKKPAEVNAVFEKAKNEFVAAIALSAYQLKVRRLSNWLARIRPAIP